jgi:FAD/FMN-containing dehydrogenase
MSEAIHVAAGDGSWTELSRTTIADFGSKLRGELLWPGDADYDERRKVWNGMIDRRPAFIARCASTEDVRRSIELARTHNLLLAVRGGGHSFPGHSVCDGGLMMDLSPLNDIQVDAAAGTATAGAGVLWGELDAATQSHELAVTGGQISHTGIAGLTLGGGIGWLVRKMGLTSDNLLSAQVVTADGRELVASTNENEDLFWALRGGGGNFGVVTSFQFRLHPLGPVLGGLVAHPLPKAKEALKFYRDFAASAPDALTTTAAFFTTPDGHPAFGVFLCYAGPLAEGEKVLRPLREYGPPAMDQVGRMRYTDVQKMLDESAAPGRRYYMRSYLLPGLDDALIDLLPEHFAAVPSPLSAVVLPQLGGAVTRLPTDATAYYHRSVAFSSTVLGGWTDPGDDARNIAWTRAFGDALQPLASGVYVNELTDEGQQRVVAAYGAETYRRLVALKAKYDPTNLFRLNQNINPAAA